MKFFLDTANIDEIRQGVEMGMVDGITTNPSLVAKEGREFRAILEDICELVDGPVSAEVVSTQFSGMIQEAHSLAEIHENIVVKIPMIFEGLKAIHQLSKEGIKVNVTLIFSASQALMAAKAGATYVSPFVGRLDDVSHPGMDVIQQIVTIFDNYDFNTQVLVASIRHPLHVVEAAMMGADVGTMPFKVLEQLIKHPLTDVGLARFLKDWEKLAV
ncbi:MAG: fructose-6-phosphate aldolase [Deltaproteobacteria bacterium]|nr:fructose-6-phosphate aldolase [Deltaproteobacteria bacterium]